MKAPDSYIGGSFDAFLEQEGIRKDVETVARKRLRRQLGGSHGGRPQTATDAQILAVMDLPWREASQHVRLSRSRYMARCKLLRDRMAAAKETS